MAATEALSDAGLSPSEVGLVLAANALGGSLNNQACIRGQAWLQPVGLDGVGVINIDNSCAGGASAFHLGSHGSERRRVPRARRRHREDVDRLARRHPSRASKKVCPPASARSCARSTAKPAAP